MKKIIVDIHHEQSKIALSENQQLREFYIERQNYKRIEGNIYKGKVENVLPGMQAAFVNIGLEKNAFLYVKDAIEKKKYEEETFPPINKIVKPGQELLVQIVKEPIGQKGARITTNITLPGRYFVFMPTTEYVGISRRIVAEGERERLRKIAYEFKPECMGVIVRTEAQGVEGEELDLDLKSLLRLWKKIQDKEKITAAPKLIHSELELTYKIVRDLFTKDIDEFIINEKQHYETVLEMVDILSPELKHRVIYYDQSMDIFDYYGLTSQLEKIFENKVWLKSGGYLIIDQTEALTVIDVNTGKFVGKTNLNDTVVTTNLEAAQEIAKQLRLRDIGGIIIIDFIDMKDERDETRVLNQLQSFLKQDRTKTNVLGMTQLGLVEMTRKKIRKSIGKILQDPCPFCKGTGRVISVETILMKIDDILRRDLYLKKEATLYIHLHPHTVHTLEYQEKDILQKLKNEYQMEFEITEDPILSPNQVKVLKHR